MSTALDHYRAYRGATSRDIARGCGVSAAMVALWAMGRRPLPWYRAYQIAGVLQLDDDDARDLVESTGAPWADVPPGEESLDDLCTLVGVRPPMRNYQRPAPVVELWPQLRRHYPPERVIAAGWCSMIAAGHPC